MSDVYLGCVKCMETLLIGDAPNSIRHMIETNPANIAYGKLVTEPEVLKDLEQFLYSHIGHDLRFADLESFKEILQSKLEKSHCWAYRESPEECSGEMHCDDDYYPGMFVAWCDRHEHPEDYKKRQEEAGKWKEPGLVIGTNR
jgi:hypothetical protein